MKDITFRFSYLIVAMLLSLAGYGQEVPPITIHVEKSGTLPSLIADSKKYQITNLTLTGKLNGTDIRYIREMAGRDNTGKTTAGVLSILDMSNAEIVAGGDYYYSTYTNKDDRYYTSNRTIGKYMFTYCILTSIAIPNNTENIEERALSGLKATSITIPNNVTTIGINAFNDAKLTSITIPNNVTTIGDYAFSQCHNLASIRLSDNLTKIEEGTFKECEKLISITIPSNVRSIGRSAFWDCTNLASVIIEDGLESIEGWAFQGCNQLTSIIIPNSVANIKEYAFINCKLLANVTFGIGLIDIGERAFSGCDSFTSVNIPDGVKNINTGAFNSCKELISVTIGNSLEKLASNAFSKCTKLANYTVSPGNKNFTSIDGVLFNKNITSLVKYPIPKNDNSYTIPDNVELIENEAFGDCNKLLSITMPESINQINDGAFSGCTIKEIYCLATTPPKCTKNSLNFDNIRKLYIPKGSYAAYWNTETWSTIKNIYELDENGNPIDKEYYIITSYDKSQGKVLINNNEVQSATITENNPVTFTIAPSTGYDIDKVILNQKDISRELIDHSYTIEKLTTHLTLEVTFKNKLFTVTTSYDDKLGNVLINNENTRSKEIKEGDEVTFTITPQKGYKIENILLGDQDVTSQLSANNTLKAGKLNSNISLEVKFKLITYNTTLTYDEVQGRVFVNGKKTKSVVLKDGIEVTFTIIPNNGYVIQQVKLGNIDITTSCVDGTYTVSQINSDLNLTVLFTNFIRENATITSSYDEGQGIVLMNGKKGKSRTIEMGKEVTFTIIPHNGYEIQQVKAGTTDITSLCTDGIYTVSEIDSNLDLVVSFKLAPIIHDDVVIATSFNKEQGIVLINGMKERAVTLAKGEGVTFTILPKDGYVIQQVMLDNNDITSLVLFNGVLFNPQVTDDMSLTATFSKVEIETVSLTINCTEGGELKREIPVGSSVTYRVLPSDSWEINTITFNGADVTSNLVDNQYTTPTITENSTLSIVFVNLGLGVKSATDSLIKVYTSQGSIMVKNAPLDTLIQVYSTSGEMIHNCKSMDNITTIEIAVSGIYFVKIGNNTYKVSIL